MCYATAMADTAFKRWRKQLGLTQEAAAERLGVSRSQVANWDAGIERTRGAEALPPKAVRVLMTLESQGVYISPWPVR